jgi:tRNA-(ms[2]io[6]A)-hydroxylase
MNTEELLTPINRFLLCETPQGWVDEAIKTENLKVLLTDHLICELKAAQSAMFLIRRYAVDADSAKALLEWLAPYEKFTYRKEGDWQALKNHQRLSKSMMVKSGSKYGQDLVDKMVLLIKEELHHFYQVLEMMEAYGIEYENISSSRYAKGMLIHVRTHEPAALIDKLICGAFIEARSCERFAKIAPYLDASLSAFYISLLRSEARHFEDYLALARSIATSTAKAKARKSAEQEVDERIAFFAAVEADLITSADQDFKFHSGVPCFEKGKLQEREQLNATQSNVA